MLLASEKYRRKHLLVGLVIIIPVEIATRLLVFDD